MHGFKVHDTLFPNFNQANLYSLPLSRPSQHLNSSAVPSLRVSLPVSQSPRPRVSLLPSPPVSANPVQQEKTDPLPSLSRLAGLHNSPL